jgi:hypothetical protein
MNRYNLLYVVLFAATGLSSGCSDDEGPRTLTILVLQKPLTLNQCPADGSAVIRYESNIPNHPNDDSGFMACGNDFFTAKPIFTSLPLEIPNQSHDYWVAVLFNNQRILEEIYIKVLPGNGREFKLTRTITVDGKPYLAFTLRPCSQPSCTDVVIN